MKRLIFSLTMIFCLAAPCGAQTLPGNGDFRAFELSPTAPPTPALKYELLFDPLDRRPGNAALLYSQAESLLNADFTKLIDKAEDAYYAKDAAGFDAAAKAMDRPALPPLLDLAARCDQYDRQLPVRELGQNVMLPHLNTDRAIATFVKLRAISQMRAGKVSDAFQTLRLGVELSRKIGSEPVLVSGLVAQGILAMMMSEPMTELMNRPDSPNLYWALASLPRPLISLQRSMEMEKMIVENDLPLLRQVNVDDLSAEQWHAIFDKAVADANLPPGSNRGWTNPQVADEVNRTLPIAAEHYAQTRHLTTDQIVEMDPFKVVATYWYDQSVILSDDQFKITALPYPLGMAKFEEFNNEYHRMVTEEPANVFLVLQGSLYRAVTTFARVDRILAALTTVEAIRSYAAAHDGALPATLDDIIDTPPMLNPATGKPFAYQVQNDTATLSDQSTGLPMKYTIKIRK
jgi:hypothetical protein